MSDIITYPENGITYDADDASGYLATRQSGVYSAQEDFSVTPNGDLTVTVGAGQAWVRPARFRGRSIIMEQPATLTLTAADSVRSRIDRIVLRYDASAKSTSLRVLEGTPDSGNPVAPAITRTALVYDLCLAEVARAASSLSITAADITDTRLDADLCGVMRDGVTGIPTDTLAAQARAKINALEETASASASAAKQSADSAAKSQAAAAGSASTASAKAGEAATSASDAAISASAAKASLTAAANSESAAGAKAGEAATSANAAAKSKESAKASEDAAAGMLAQIKAIANGAQGWYASPDALTTAAPTGEAGWWAIVGTTGTIWIWDVDGAAWRDSATRVDLSDYYTKTQTDTKLNGKASSTHTHTTSQISDFPAIPTVPSSLKNPYALTLKTNGTTQATYDGSAGRSVNITASSIGLGNVDNTADADKNVSYAESAGSVVWSNVTNKPSSYTPATHTHTKSQITDFPAIPTVPTSLKNPYSLILKANGITQATYDGSESKSVNITAALIGALASDSSAYISNVSVSSNTLYVTRGDQTYFTVGLSSGAEIVAKEIGENNSYIRLSNGVQICWGFASYKYVTFLAPFVDDNSVGFASHLSSSNTTRLVNSTKSTLSANFLDWVAVGLWK